MDRDLALAALKDTATGYRATTRWLTWCAGLQAAKVAAGLYEKAEYDTELSISIERTYTAAHKAPTCPSKAHKHQMYANAYRAAALVGLDIAPGSIQTLEGISKVMDQVAAALA